MADDIASEMVPMSTAREKSDKHLSHNLPVAWAVHGLQGKFLFFYIKLEHVLLKMHKQRALMRQLIIGQFTIHALICFCLCTG